jgi:8-oxo-dGTP pyrophosphatase MutT (NUDIX family)/ribosomal protein S18 acetylase RimI-like enzyme
MLIRYVIQSDLASWLNLADDVAPIFRAPDMSRDPEFLDYVKSKIAKNEALIAIDLATSSCMGIIGFSRTHNRITWFGVYEMHQGKGVGTKLLRTALDELDRSREITVETYREDYAPGLAARNVYKKFGFLEIENGLYDKLGNPICKMALSPPDGSMISMLEPLHYHNRSFFPMKLIREIHHGDLGLTSNQSFDEIPEVKYEVRKSARAILIDAHGKVALLHVAKEGYYKLPGGGIEENEDVLTALKRELREEVGAEIEVINPVGIIVEYRDYFQQLQFSYAFLCHVISPLMEPKMTDLEKSLGFEVVWTTIDHAIDKTGEYKGNLYMPRFIAIRDATLLTEAKKILGKSTL